MTNPYGSVYAGSVSWGWFGNGPVSTTVTFSSLPQVRFNAVRLENATLQSKADPNIAFNIFGPIFVNIDTLRPIANDIIAGVRVNPIGAVVWGGANQLAIGKQLRPKKITTTSLDTIRSDWQVTFTDVNGKLIDYLPDSFFASFTVSLWQESQGLFSSVQ